MNKRKTFKVTCPSCRSSLVIDAEAKVVVGHEAPPVESTASFEERMQTLSKEKRLAEEKFQESIRTEKSKKEVLEQKFQDLVKKVKDEPIGPMTKEIDLD